MMGCILIYHYVVLQLMGLHFVWNWLVLKGSYTCLMIFSQIHLILFVFSKINVLVMDGQFTSFEKIDLGPMFFWGANFHIVVTKKKSQVRILQRAYWDFLPKCSIIREKDYQKLPHLSTTFMEVVTTKRDFEKKIVAHLRQSPC